MLHFDLRDLRVFTAIVLTGSITRAAEYVHLSPSATSDRLADLEKRLGIRLFLRQPRGMTLTSAGEVFERSAQRILHETDELEAKLSPFTYAWEKRLRIFSNYNAAVTYLPKYLGRFLSMHSDVQIDVIQAPSPEVVKQIAAGEGDIGVTAFTGSHPLLNFIPFSIDCLVGVVPPMHPLANCSSIAFSDLFPYNYIGIGPYSAMQEFLNKRAQEEGKTLRPHIIASSHDAVISLVAEGAGVSVLPSGVITKSKRVIELPLTEPWAIRRLRLCFRKDPAGHTPTQQKLMEELLAALMNGESSV